MTAMLTQLRAALDRAAARRAEAAKVVEEIEAPRRKLAEEAAAEQAAADALAKAEADKAQWEAELFDCKRWLAAWEPFETKLAGAIEVLDALSDAAMNGASSSNLSPRDLSHAAAQCRSQREYLEMRRTERDRLQSSLRKLNG